MKYSAARTIVVVAALVAPSTSCEAQPQEHVTVIRNVTVVTGTGAVVRRADVWVDGEQIARVRRAGEAPLELPPGAEEIDGTGMYLIPGLFEMHAHTSKTRASALGLYVYNGVTTVRDVGGDHEELLSWRKEIRNGERLGPRLLIAGPYLESNRYVERVLSTPPRDLVEPVERTRLSIGSVEDAHRVVDSLAALELDFLKVRTVASEETFYALNEAAARNGLQLVGHTMGLSPEQIVEAGHDGVEHFVLPRLDDRTHEERMEAWHAFARAGIIVVPTLVTFTEHAFPSQAELQAVVDDSLGELDGRRKYLARYLILDWAEQVAEASEDRQNFFRTQWPIELQYIREMREAGVAVLPGSDVAAINIFPGWSLIDELVLFQDSVGMPAAEVLELATRVPAEFLGIADSVGTVEEGKIADLVLLRANPLEDIANVREISAVMVRGVVLDQGDLEQVLQDVHDASDRYINDWPRENWSPPEESADRE